MIDHAKPVKRTVFGTWHAVSLPKLVLLIGPLVIVLIGILGLAIQLNRQLSGQQQADLNFITNSSIRNAAQLQRENLRLLALLNNRQAGIDHEALQQQRDLLNSRVLIFGNTLKLNIYTPALQQTYQDVIKQWQRIDPMLAHWSQHPNEITRETIIARLNQLDLTVNHLVSATQLHFEDRLLSLTTNSRFINRLLTGASISFLCIMLFMSYITLLFFRTQSLNEQVLRRSERRLRAILNTIPDAVYRVDAQGVYLDYKPAKATFPHQSTTAQRAEASVIEESPERVIGKQLAEILPAELATLLNTNLKEILTTGEEKLLEYRTRHEPSGTPRTFEVRCVPDGLDEVQIIVRDVTEVKQQDEAALQAQKLESLGVLAGGIAHDFNNLLTGLLGQISLAKAKLGRGLSGLEHINKAVISAERAADLTRQLLAYAGKGKFQIRPLNLNELIRDTAGLMETAIPSHAQLQLRLDEALPLIQADRGQIQQVVMNLFINAIEALLHEQPAAPALPASPQAHQAHQIEITTSVVAVEAGRPPHGQPSWHELAGGRYVTLKVTDSGVGMDEATLSRIFDPFFTTKPKGHGLGLSATMGIIRTHGGTLQVQSQLGKGTTFSVWLPAVTAAALIESSPAITPNTPLPAKQPKVLVIDDEELIREAIIDILAADGLRVSTAANGQEGIERFQAERQEIGLILLDMKMPGLNGTQTYAELQALAPDLKVIFTSGDSEAESAAGIKANSRIAFLPKPYTAEALVQQVHRMLAI